MVMSETNLLSHCVCRILGWEAATWVRRSADWQSRHILTRKQMLDFRKDGIRGVAERMNGRVENIKS